MTIRVRAVVAVVLVSLLMALPAGASHKLSGSLAVGGNSSCVVAPECQALRLTCNSAFVKADGVMSSIVDAGGVRNQSGRLTWTGTTISAGDYLVADFLTSACKATGPGKIVNTSGGTVAVPSDAKYMAVTSQWTVGVKWTLTLIHV